MTIVLLSPITKKPL